MHFQFLIKAEISQATDHSWPRFIENITHPMSQSCYIVAVWHIKQILHKIS
jgi:hypothetical protein